MRFAWYRTATRSTDAFLMTVIEEALPTEESVRVPGISDFARACWRRVMRTRKAARADLVEQTVRPGDRSERF
jgi:hypothetical protein